MRVLRVSGYSKEGFDQAAYPREVEDMRVSPGCGLRRVEVMPSFQALNSVS